MFSKKDMTDAHTRQAEQVAFRRKLEKQGHTCVEVKETYPSQTNWCKQEKCVNSK